MKSTSSGSFLQRKKRLLDEQVATSNEDIEDYESIPSRPTITTALTKSFSELIMGVFSPGSP